MILYRLASWLKRGRRGIASYRDHAELRECDARILRDIGLYRERGRLRPLHPQQQETMD